MDSFIIHFVSSLGTSILNSLTLDGTMLVTGTSNMLFISLCYPTWQGLCAMAESQQHWYNRQAIEQLAQHIPFERDSASKAEQIEMLRGLVIRHGREMDPELFGFEARNELIRLGLWNRIGWANE